MGDTVSGRVGENNEETEKVRGWLEKVHYRAMKKAKATMDINKVNNIMLEAMKETEQYVKNYITGLMYVQMFVILRRPPYRWPMQKAYRYLQEVGGLMKALNENKITEEELIAEGEERGLSVKYESGNYKYVKDFSPFEEGAE